MTMVSMQVRDVDGIRTVDLTNWDDLCNVSDLIIQELGGK
jgi:hypothetical protein